MSVERVVFDGVGVGVGVAAKIRVPVIMPPFAARALSELTGLAGRSSILTFFFFFFLSSAPMDFSFSTTLVGLPLVRGSRWARTPLVGNTTSFAKDQLGGSTLHVLARGQILKQNHRLVRVLRLVFPFHRDSCRAKTVSSPARAPTS